MCIICTYSSLSERNLMLIKWRLCEETDLSTIVFSTVVEDERVMSLIHEMRDAGVEEKEIEPEILDWIWRQVDQDFNTRISPNIIEDDMMEKVSKILKEMAA